MRLTYVACLMIGCYVLGLWTAMRWAKLFFKTGYKIGRRNAIVKHWDTSTIKSIPFHVKGSQN